MNAPRWPFTSTCLGGLIWPWQPVAQKTNFFKGSAKCAWQSGTVPTRTGYSRRESFPQQTLLPHRANVGWAPGLKTCYEHTGSQGVSNRMSVTTHLRAGSPLQTAPKYFSWNVSLTESRETCMHSFFPSFLPFLVFQGRISLYSPGCPDPHCSPGLQTSGLELTEIRLLLPQECWD